MLLCNQARAYACPQMLVQEACYILGLDIFSGFQKTSCQYADRIRVGLHQVSHDFGEPDLLVERFDFVLRPW